MTDREKEVLRAVARAMCQPNDRKATEAADAFIFLYLPMLGRAPAYIRHEALAMLIDKVITGGIDG